MDTDIADIIALLSSDLLSCHQCDREFNSKECSPKALPCYHSICSICVEQLTVDGRVKCPKCQQVAVMEKVLPTDPTRATLMDLKELLQSQVEFTCDCCSDGAKATNLCQDCAEYLCKSCTDNHCLEMPLQHTVVSLSQAIIMADLLAQMGDKCEHHDEEKLKLYCLTCSTALCSICALSMHIEGHKFVELQNIVDEKKRKVLLLCEQLDKAQKAFQERAAESEASLSALALHQQETETRLQEAFLQVMAATQQRQMEVLEELHVKVNADRLLLEEQLANFQTLQAATQSAAEFGRRLVSLSLVSQIMSHSADIERLAADVREKLQVPVMPAPVYRVETKKLDELKACLREIGTIELGANSDSSSTTTLDVDVEALALTFPDIKLDAVSCHRDCTVSEDGYSLSNQHQPSSPSLSQQKFTFRGTCSTLPVPMQTCYWQVKCKVVPDPEIAEEWLCEVGVASLEALHAGGEWIASPGSRALTVVLRPLHGNLHAWVCFSGLQVADTEVAPFDPCSPIDCTLGFIFHAPTMQMAIIDVQRLIVLHQGQVDASQPLWPCVSVYHTACRTSARTCLSLKSSKNLNLAPPLVSLLNSVLDSCS